VAFDMAAIADRTGAVVSAVLLGAVAGANVLSFGDDTYRAAIRATGRSVDANLAAFEAGAAASRALIDTPAAAAVPMASASTHATGGMSASEAAITQVPAALAARIETFPNVVQGLLRLAAARLVDYQDAAHAAQYLDRVAAVLAREPDPAGDLRLTREVAQRLALWMSFEDTIRVADLKTRCDRAARIRATLRAREDRVVKISEFMKPRVEEICGTLPSRLGAGLLASPAWRQRLGRFTGDRTITTTSIGGFALLRAVAGLRRWRRGTLRYRVEDERIRDWLSRVAELAGRDYELAVEVAANQRLVKGYGDTHARGWQAYSRLLAVAAPLAGQADSARTMRRLREAALADEHGHALDRALAELDRAVA
jgi:indolepyruvate ferredoxin oxidoreductase beta subunit